MARIPEAELQHLKAAVPLVAVVRSQGRQLFKQGKDFTVLCPFHDEKTPSCVISPGKNLYHCFGCNAGGSVIDWVMQTEKLSLRKAAERLRAELGENPVVVPLVTKDEPEIFADDEVGRQLLLNRVTDFYHHTLLNAPEAVAYLEKRRLNHPELVAAFKLGFANRTLVYRLPEKKLRAGYARLAAAELGLSEGALRRSLGRVLLALENRQAQPEPENSVPDMSAEAREAALELLRSPDLAERIAADMAACGVVGESVNLTAAYLAAVSRKLEKPLAVLIQSSSAAGKSSLMDAVLNLMPEEERMQYSAMTGQSLFYLGETNLQHKILAIAEEEGVRQAAYALKLLQSDGELTIASTGKDEATGSLVTKQYTVKGPVMLMLTTTATDVDEELLNRCLVLTVNESREQTEAIHVQQRYAQTLEGLLASNEKSYITALHQNAQRLLRPLNVVNPFAGQLTFLSNKTCTRRDHMKYLTLIQSVALLHQYQREVKRVEHRGQVVEYIEVERSDIALANRLAHEILGRTLDEMPPQTRKLLTLIQQWVRESGQPRPEWRFTRKQLRDAVQWGDTQLKIHLARLTELEYLLVHRRGLTFCY